MKKLLFWSVLALGVVFATSAIAGNLKGPMQAEVLIRGDEPIPNVTTPPVSGGLITNSPGDTVGFTEYDYQCNGSTGNRVVADNVGGAHFAWMKGMDTQPDGGGPREVWFNYTDGTIWLASGGQPLSMFTRGGYTQISITSDDCAGVAYHETSNWAVTYAEDQYSGYGLFNYFNPPEDLEEQCLWPYITLDRNNNIHIVSVEARDPDVVMQDLSYTVSTDGGESWSRLHNVETLSTISQNVVASPVSDKVAIVYNYSTRPSPPDPPVAAQLYNTVYYIESEDGLTWDWENGKVDVTGYTDRDSLQAYTDLAAIYDYNDNLHIIWNAQFVYETPEGFEVSFHIYLYHYNDGSGTINMITETDTAIDTLWETGNCQVTQQPSRPFGAWNRPLTKMSLGVYHDDDIDGLFALWTQFDPSDCSVAGWANGDLYYSYTINGTDWVQSVNVTNSNSDGCARGDCDSDHWATLANRVDDSLHIVYINDKDAGGVPQTEGEVTVNPVLYLEVQNPLLTGIDEDQSIPHSFALSQNYPNPFNARTSIQFELLENSRVKLSVYDITGARVATLVNGDMEAGLHSINWDAEKVASGVYYYSLKANGEESARKMTLLK